jgi:hypothetical protein
MKVVHSCGASLNNCSIPRVSSRLSSSESNTFTWSLALALARLLPQ